MSENKGELYKKIKGCRTHAYVSDENCDVTAVVYVRAVKKDYLIKMLDEAKAEFLKIIKKPVANDYELGIPAEREQLDHDCELYELFVKWFGASK
jgi:hypothetical protein